MPICAPCANRQHHLCRDCPCHHRPTPTDPPPAGDMPAPEAPPTTTKENTA